MDVIQFNAEREIYLPADVELLQGCLHWKCEIAEDGFEDPFKNVGEERSIDGCLDAFTLLYNAAPEVVLAFARQYGVLGVMPSGATEASFGMIASEPSVWRFRYAEPVSIYQDLARQARSIRLVMADLRSGKLIDPSEYLACFPGRLHLNAERPAKMSRRLIYMNIVGAVRNWSERANYKFRLGYGSGFWPGANPSWIPHHILGFGDWNQGASWDLHQMPMLIADTYESEAYRQSVRDLALRVAAVELGMDSPEQIYCLPSRSQRPSPLFNVLAFQLTQALTVAEGTYLCSGCKKFTSPKEGRNKPRADKENWNCSAACERKFKSEVDKKRGQTNKIAKQNTPAGH